MFGVTQQSARKWLEGEAFPDTRRIADIARRLRINLDWFLSGHGYHHLFSRVKEFPSNASPDWSKVPILKWNDASRWKEAYGLLQFEESVPWTWADVVVSPYAYALEMPNDSMEPRYEKGSIIVIDPYYIPSSGHIVIFALPNEQSPVCGQLISNGKTQFVQPHNTKYEAIRINKRDKYCGSIRQARMIYK